MLKRLVAVLTTVLLAVGLSVGVAAPASAHTPNYDATCDSLDLRLTQYDNGDNRVTVVIDGVTVESNKRFGTSFTASYSWSTTESHSYKIVIDAVGSGYDKTITGTSIPCASTGLTCDAATLYKGSPLSNGDHINMDVVINGTKRQVNAYVDVRQAQDPASESGLVVRVTLPSGQVALPLSNAARSSGVFVFEYSKGWTGSWTVEWVQYNSKYFNQDRVTAKFLHCQSNAPVTVTTAPSATNPTCVADGTLVLPAIPNITWSGATNGAGPGTYTVTAVANPGYTLTGQSSWTITVKPKGDGVNCVEAVQPTLTVAQCDAATGALVSAFITIPTTANLAYRIGGGAPFTPGQKVELIAGTHVVDVVATNGFTNTGPSSFTIVVPAFDCNKAVAPAMTSAQCDAAGDLVPGFITIPSTTPGLEYRIAGVNGGAPLSGTVNLAAGSYTVTVTAKAGYTNTGPSSFPITIAALDCERAVEPALTLAICDATTGLFRSAFVTIPSTTPGLEYRISTINGGTPVTGDVNLPAGTYTVTVTAKTGVTNTGPSSFTVVVPALECERAVEPTLTVAQCDATTGAFTSAFVTIPSTTPGLEYRIAGVNGGAPLSGTVNLPAGSYTVTVTAKPGVTNTGASSFPITVAALGCERAIEPTLTVAQCDATTGAVQGATLTAATSTPNLTYTIRGGAVLTPGVPVDVVAGSYVIEVAAAAGWTNTGPASFTIDVDDLDCTEAVAPTVTAAQCDATTGPVSGFVTIPTTTPGLVYSIGGTDYAAGAEVELPAGVHTVDVRALPGWTNTGEDSFEVTIAAVDCVEEDVVEPAVTDQSCDADLGGTKGGSLLFTLNPALTYTLGGQTVTDELVSGVAPGTYTVTVTAQPGHYLKGGVGTFEITVKAAVDCDPVYTTPLDPFANPEICDPQSTGKLDGSITIVHLAGIQWYIATKADGSDKVAVGDATTTGSQVYAKPAGQYYVFAESQDPSIAIKPGHEVWPVDVEFPSQLCTLGHFDPSATAAPAVCTATGDPRGTITVDIMDGVSYAFKDGAAITTATTLVAPGTYTVVATPDDPRSTLSEDEWVLTVAAPGIFCDLETLALTGQTPAGAVLAAILLLQAGLALVAVRFVQRRRARHVA